MQQTGSWIQKIAILYIVVWSIAPPLGIDMIYRFIAIGCVGIWGIVALGRGYLVEKIHVYAVMFAILVAGVAYLQTGSVNGILQQISLYMLVICFLMNAFYNEKDWGELSIIVPILLILLIYFNYSTIQALIDDPGIARKIVRADEETYQFMRDGVGGYGLIYPQVCIFPAILAWIRSAMKHNKLYFVIGCIWLYTFIGYLSKAGYSIAIYASVVGVIILFLYKGRNVGKAVLISATIFIGVILAIIYVEGFRTALLELFDGTEVVTKINDLLEMDETGESDGSIYERIKMYKASLTTILNYPVIGGLWHASGGGHSAILDVFAKYGIFGGYVFCVALFYISRYYKRGYNADSAIGHIPNAVTIALLYVAILNSFSFNFMAMILIVQPILYDDIIRWEKIEHESFMDS